MVGRLEGYSNIVGNHVRPLSHPTDVLVMYAARHVTLYGRGRGATKYHWQISMSVGEGGGGFHSGHV